MLESRLPQIEPWRSRAKAWPQLRRGRESDDGCRRCRPGLQCVSLALYRIEQLVRYDTRVPLCAASFCQRRLRGLDPVAALFQIVEHRLTRRVLTAQQGTRVLKGRSESRSLAKRMHQLQRRDHDQSHRQTTPRTRSGAVDQTVVRNSNPKLMPSA